MSIAKKPVRVYRNLHKKLWSILDSRGRVWRRVPYLWLVNCTFVVRPAGQKKARLERRKNVHAFVKGFQTSIFAAKPDELVPIGYSPYHGETFRRLDTDEPIQQADVVVLDADGKAYAKLS